MNKYYINISSVTYAMKARDILSSNGFRANLKRNTNKLKGESCGYSLIIDRDIDDAVNILKVNNIKILSSGRASGKI